MAQYQYGTCGQMCPEEEAAFRTKENLLHGLERRTNGESYVLVKEYRRSAAGRASASPRQLRTTRTLINTTNYLINEVCDFHGIDWACIYEFVFDRLRAVRQELVIQTSICDEKVVYILEKCVKFYLVSISRLKERPTREFDMKINHTHIQECIKQLLVLYKGQDVESLEDGDTGKDKSVRKYKNRSEFESIYILFNLGYNEALVHFLTLPSELRLSPRCLKAWRFCLSISQHNYVRAFRIQRELDELQLCALHSHIKDAKSKFLERMNAAYSSKTCKFPLSTLCSLIGGVDKQDMISLLTLHGIETTDGFARFSKSSWKT